MEPAQDDENPGTPNVGQGNDGVERFEPVEPRLLVPIERTPLPEVDQAMPLLSLFPAVLGRHRGRYKVALLKTLQTEGTGRWKIREIQDVVFWLEPSTVAELVRDLRDGEVLSYDPMRSVYRLTPTGRVISALLAALTKPEVEPRRLIKYLSLAMSFALVGGSTGAARASFASAVAVLRVDVEELRRLIDDNSKNALREAADLVSAHVQDMRELLDEHERFRMESSEDPDFLRLEQDAMALMARLGDAVADVLLWLTGKANEVMRGGAPIDRGDVREFVAGQEPTQLARLISDLVRRPPFVPCVSGSRAFDALADKADLNRPVPPPLPTPSTLKREPLRLHRDPSAELVDELHSLERPTNASEVVVRRDWPTSVARHHAFIDVYNRREVALPELEIFTEVEEPRRAGVARISKTTIAAGDQ